jgi:hypothetical protein
LVLVGLYFWLVFPLKWETKSYKKAPDGEVVAYHLQSRSEAGDAPYGDHIILARNYWPLGQYYGETVFAAYCTDAPKYRWLNSHLLQIECETEKVMKKMEVLNDVHIQYNNV